MHTRQQAVRFSLPLKMGGRSECEEAGDPTGQPEKAFNAQSLTVLSNTEMRMIICLFSLMQAIATIHCFPAMRCCFATRLSVLCCLQLLYPHGAFCKTY